jgi:glycosyltransferase involved in cell wall biosynthesis
MIPASDGKLRVLLIAELCSPLCPSIPLEGYNYACALLENPELDVTLVTHVRNQEALEAYPISKKTSIVFIDTESISRPLNRLSCALRMANTGHTLHTALMYPGYLAFEWAILRRYRDRFRRGEFDLIHRVTPMSPTTPSPLAWRARIPMIAGPLNGGLSWPREYPNLISQEKELLARVRHFYRYMPGIRATYRNLTGVIAGSESTAREIRPLCRGRVYRLAENGVDPKVFPFADAWPEPVDGFRFLTAGRLVPYKGMDLILEALHGSSALASARLTIVGDGPFHPHLADLTNRLGLSDRVEFTGHLTQERMVEVMNRSQCFVLPSLREFGGAVVLEAMTRGLPPIVVDYGGPGEHVTPECGIALPMVPRVPMIAALRAAMESLASDPDRCRRLSEAARRRTRAEYTWEIKAARLVAIYRDVLEHRRLNVSCRGSRGGMGGISQLWSRPS